MLVSVTVHSKELSTWRKTWFGLITGFLLLFVCFCTWCRYKCRRHAVNENYTTRLL